MFSTTVYFLETGANKQRHVLCRLVDFFYEAGRRVQVITDSSLAAQNLDQLLWTFSEESFIPHRVLGSSSFEPVPEPVVITPGAFFLEGFDHLVCDSPAALEVLKRYRVAVHFVLKDDVDRRQESRLLWLACGEHGVGRYHVSDDMEKRWSEVFKLK